MTLEIFSFDEECTLFYKRKAKLEVVFPNFGKCVVKVRSGPEFHLNLVVVLFD